MSKAQQAFQRGVAALAQWIEREGVGTAVPRGHIETLVIGGEKHEHKLGVWVSNIKSRRDRLSEDQRAALAQLGIEWV